MSAPEGVVSSLAMDRLLLRLLASGPRLCSRWDVPTYRVIEQP